ncbi:KdsC family phosphatase [Phascolarctobacterium sp.]|uniref:KdsC family phosphatase n=1 Tax=Phascolarctobacterium sp. TaxID=2049039 RepID=UPI003866EC81
MSGKSKEEFCRDLQDEPWFEDTQERMAAIRLLALDVDGVLTDGTINIGENGELFKGFNAKDGMGVSLALRSGLQVAIITGRRSAIIHRRAQELGITHICEGIKDKAEALRMLCAELQLDVSEAAFMGDDLNDIPAIVNCGFAFAPADAVEEVCSIVDMVTFAQGGRGAVREAIQKLLEAQGKWQKLVAAYFQSGQGDKQ